MIRFYAFIALLFFSLPCFAQSLDTNAWTVPEGDYLGAGPANPPYIGWAASELSVSPSGLTNNVEYGPFVFPGGPGENGPVTLPLKGGALFWKKMQMLYGTVEIQAKLTGVGTHSTLWLLGAQAQRTALVQNPNVTSGAYPNPVNEIDIAERWSGSPYTAIAQTLHGNSVQSSFTTPVTDYTQNFHTYKIVWAPGVLTWYVDGVQTNQTTTQVPFLPMFLIIDEESDSNSGAPVSGNFPQQEKIAYVKAWDQSSNLIFQDNFDGTPAFQNLSQVNLSYIQSESQLSFSGNTGSIPVGNTTSYSLLFAQTFCNTTGAQTLTDSLLNTWTKVGTIGQIQLWEVPSNKVLGGTDTVLLTCPNADTFHTLQVSEYTGQDLTHDPVDVSAFAHGGAGTATSATIATSFTNETLLVLGLSDGTVAAGTGFTSRLIKSSNGQNTLLEDRQVVVPGSYFGTYTGPSSYSDTDIVGLRSAASQSSGSQVSPFLVGQE